MKIVNKVVKRVLRKHYLKKGFHMYMASLYAEGITEELLDNPDKFPLSKRIWAWKRGFLAERIKMYDLTNENYTKYLSDYDYYKMFPLNNEFSRWIDDKLTLKYVLHKYDAYLPAYFAEIKADGTVLALMDWPHEITSCDASGVAELVKKFKNIAVKQHIGSAGEGFYWVWYEDGCYYANGKKMNEREFCSFVKSLGGYLVTEFIKQSAFYDDIYAGATHTLRVQTAKGDDGKPFCLFSFMRWGDENQNYCVSHSVHGVAATVDANTGIIDHAFYADEEGYFHDVNEHRNTHKSLVGKIQRWDEIVSRCLEIHNYMNELAYLGFDVVITDDGFKIIEINSHSGIRTVQRNLPFLADEKCAAYFKKHIKN